MMLRKKSFHLKLSNLSKLKLKLLQKQMKNQNKHSQVAVAEEIQITKKVQQLTAVWRNWGFRQTLKLVLYLEVRSLIYTFG